MDKSKYTTNIWYETEDKTNPFHASQCFCFGYDVYQDILPKASWPEYILLLFHGERPNIQQRHLFEKLSITLAHPGLRDHSVLSAMNAGVPGNNPPNCLIAAIAAGSGQYQGCEEVARSMLLQSQIGRDVEKWKEFTNYLSENETKLWQEERHLAGFDVYASNIIQPVSKTLQFLQQIYPNGQLQWLWTNHDKLSTHTGQPINLISVYAAAFLDLKMTHEQAKFLFLILRLPGAAVQALEQSKLGSTQFPFYTDKVVLADEPTA